MKELDPDARKKEDHWFHEADKKLIRRLKLEREAKQREKERSALAEAAEELRRVHWLHCPKCGNVMGQEHIKDIEVDVCSHCEGVFFDRGELEELMLNSDEDRRGFFRRVLGLSAR
ncbi:MAG: zf-TFIIB domain-containing protein [Acidobacteriota bacterium]|jgi:uncharacterized protein